MSPKPYMDICGLNPTGGSLYSLLMSLPSPLMFSCCSRKRRSRIQKCCACPLLVSKHPLASGNTSSASRTMYGQWWVMLNNANRGSDPCSRGWVFIIILVTSVSVSIADGDSYCLLLRSCIWLANHLKRVVVGGSGLFCKDGKMIIRLAWQGQSWRQ